MAVLKLISVHTPFASELPESQGENNFDSLGSASTAARSDHRHAVPSADSTEQATQAALEAETDENTYVPPDLVHFSPGVSKVWAAWEQTGAHGLLASYNMTSVTDGNGAGDTDHLWDTDFSSVDYSVLLTSEKDEVAGVTSGTRAAAGLTSLNITASTGGAIDSALSSIAAFGDQ